MTLVEIITTIEEDGELTLLNLPVKKGQQIRVQIEDVRHERGITASEFLQSEFLGMWAEREDIQDSSEFSQQLRDQMQHRHRNSQ